MSRSHHATRLGLLAVAPVLALSVSSLWSRGAGILPDDPEVTGTLTRGLPSCGQCHRTFPGGNFLRVRVELTARSLAPGQSIQVTTSSTGGRPHAQNWGGFCSDVTAGTFSAGSNSWVGMGGAAITHLAAFQSNNRTWQYGYTAPTQPGPVEMFAVVNTVNGDGRNGGEDLWAFHGGDGLATEPTPVRLFVNAIGVTPVGDSCVGSFGNYPVLGAAETPSAGNANFKLELRGAATSQPLVVLIGTPINPVDLTALGITGCNLHVFIATSVVLATSSGNAALSEGAATVPLPIPNGVRGTLRVQAAFADPGNGRPLPVTLTNALDLAIS